LVVAIEVVGTGFFFVHEVVQRHIGGIGDFDISHWFSDDFLIGVDRIDFSIVAKKAGQSGRIFFEFFFLFVVIAESEVAEAEEVDIIVVEFVVFDTGEEETDIIEAEFVERAIVFIEFSSLGIRTEDRFDFAFGNFFQSDGEGMVGINTNQWGSPFFNLLGTLCCQVGEDKLTVFDFIKDIWCREDLLVGTHGER
jgi:hypothetical protein